jgi:hypothetical protein
MFLMGTKSNTLHCDDNQRLRRGHISIQLRTEECEQIKKDDKRFILFCLRLFYHGEDDI